MNSRVVGVFDLGVVRVTPNAMPSIRPERLRCASDWPVIERIEVRAGSAMDEQIEKVRARR
jgi:hypothetical protein